MSAIDDSPRHLAPSARRRQATLVALALVAAAGLAAALALGGADDDQAAVTGGGAGTTQAPPPDPEATTTTSQPETTTTRGELGSGEPVTIAFAGDMYFEGVLRNRLDADPATAVGPFADVLRAADLAVGNLETAIAVGGTKVDKQFTFRAPPSAVDALRAAGFDTMSMANNHGLDFGADGFEETLDVKRAQPDDFLIGVGGDEDEAYAPFTAEVKGQRIAVIAATQVLDNQFIEAWTATATKGGMASAKRVDRLVQAVQDVRADADTVVVYLHWGIETETCPSGDQQTLARTLAEAGADVIVGGHAHRLQGGGRLGDAVVHYGLGNFLFKENSAAGARTGVFEVMVTGRRVDGYRWVPGRISNSVPAPLTGDEAAAALAYWEGLRGCAGLAP